MPRHLLTIAARGHCVDVQTNALTLFAVLEELRGAEAGAGGEFSVVTLWDADESGESQDHEQRVQLLDPQGQELVCGTMPLHIQNPRHRVFATVACPPLTQSGWHAFAIGIRPEGAEDWQEVFRYPFLVTAPAPMPADNLLDPQE